MAPFVWKSRIRFVDTDASRRIHYTALFRHFEAAEIEFLRSIGTGYPDLDRSEVNFPRVHVEADFVGALVYDDPVAIEVSVERVGNSSFTLAYSMKKEGREAARGRITAVCMNLVTEKAEPLPEELREKLRGAVRA